FVAPAVKDNNVRVGILRNAVDFPGVIEAIAVGREGIGDAHARQHGHGYFAFVGAIAHFGRQRVGRGGGGRGQRAQLVAGREGQRLRRSPDDGVIAVGRAFELYRVALNNGLVRAGFHIHVLDDGNLQGVGSSRERAAGRGRRYE
nr:hypothetical protein [Tanacetum cinerariifolium]